MPAEWPGGVFSVKMLSVSPTESRRPYRGLTAEQRRAQRRSALIAAASELWREQGWAAVTMRGVCARASLTDRYFYESFADRDAVLVAVAESVRDEVMALIVAAAVKHGDGSPGAQLRAAIEAVVDLIVEAPGNAGIFFGDHGGNELLESVRRATINSTVGLFMTLARPHLATHNDETEFRISLLVGIGGFVETVVAWRSGALEVTSEALVEMLMGVSRRLGHGFVDLRDNT